VPVDHIKLEAIDHLAAVLTEDRGTRHNETAYQRQNRKKSSETDMRTPKNICSPTWTYAWTAIAAPDELAVEIPGVTIPSFPWPGVRMPMRPLKNAPSAILTVA